MVFLEIGPPAAVDDRVVSQVYCILIQQCAAVFVSYCQRRGVGGYQCHINAGSTSCLGKQREPQGAESMQGKDGVAASGLILACWCCPCRGVVESSYQSTATGIWIAAVPGPTWRAAAAPPAMVD